MYGLGEGAGNKRWKVNNIFNFLFWKMSIGELDKKGKSQSRKVCILHVPAKQKVCWRSRNNAGEFTSRLREGLLLGFCVWEVLRGWPDSLDNKNQRRNCRWRGEREKKPTFSLRTATTEISALSRLFKSSRRTCRWRISTKERSQNAENVQVKPG